MLSNIALRSNLIPVVSYEARFHFLRQLSAVELHSLDKRFREWGPLLREKGQIEGVPTDRQLEEWDCLTTRQPVNIQIRSRRFRWILLATAEAGERWEKYKGDMNEESAIEYLWLTNRFLDTANRYLSLTSPLSEHWKLKRRLQLEVSRLEYVALTIHEHVSSWLQEHGISGEAQKRRIANLEIQWP